VCLLFAYFGNDHGISIFNMFKALKEGMDSIVYEYVLLMTMNLVRSILLCGNFEGHCHFKITFRF
jgi:hypothetical protein